MIKTLWIALLLLLSGATTPQASNPVLPVSGQAVTADKDHSRSEKPGENSERAGVAVNIAVGGNLTNSTNDTKEKANTESSKWTDPITLFTGFLVLVGFAQVAVYLMQTKIMTDALKATQTAANAAEMAAVAARNQSSIMGNQYDLLVKQSDLARQEFISSHRPRLVVRNFRLLIDHKASELRVSYRISNIGNTPATIVGWNESWRVSPNQPFPLVPEYQPNKILDGVLPIDGGMSWPASRRLGDDNAGDIFRQLVPPATGHFLHFYGFVRYQDALGRDRELYFCRYYDVAKARFTVDDDAEHEYSD